MAHKTLSRSLWPQTVRRDASGLSQAYGSQHMRPSTTSSTKKNDADCKGRGLMMRRFTTTLTLGIAVLCWGCAGTTRSGSMGTADRMSTGAAVGESGEMTASERDGNIFTFPAPGQAPCEPDGRSNFAANPALGSSMPPGFNCPGGGGGGGD